MENIGEPKNVIRQDIGGTVAEMVVAEPLPNRGVHLDLAGGATVVDLPQAAVRYFIGKLMAAGGVELAAIVDGHLVIQDSETDPS